MNNPLLHRLIKEKKGDVVHTSSFGATQNAGNIGASSSMSFEHRMAIEKNRKRVRAYADAELMVNSWSRKPAIGRSQQKTRGTSVNAGKKDSSSRFGEGQRKTGANMAGRQGHSSLPVRKNPGISR